MGERKVTIKKQWNNLCYMEGGENPSEKPGRQEWALDLDAHGHVGLFKCTKSRKWACHSCKQYGYFANSK